jgi:hypothetical protein
MRNTVKRRKEQRKDSSNIKKEVKQKKWRETQKEEKAREINHRATLTTWKKGEKNVAYSVKGNKRLKNE